MKVKYYGKDSQRVTEQDWVSVYDRLPTYEGRYVTCNEYGKVDVTMYFKSGWAQPWGATYARILYWCELPIAPIGA